MLLPNAKQDARPHHLAHQLLKKGRLHKRVAVRLQHLARRLQAVDEQHLGVAKAQVPDEGRVRPLAHPLEVQVVGAGRSEEADCLADEELVVLDVIADIALALCISLLFVVLV